MYALCRYLTSCAIKICLFTLFLLSLHLKYLVDEHLFYEESGFVFSQKKKEKKSKKK